MPIHLRYGGSTAERTMACPGWTTQAAALPVAAASEAANLGTSLHRCMEMWAAGTEMESLVGKPVLGTVITDELVETKLMPAIEAYEELCEANGIDINDGDFEVFMMDDDDIGGTADVVTWGGDCMAIVDWKFGDGIQVSPEENGQGLFYAMMVASEEKYAKLYEAAKRILIVIIQPNNRGEQILKVWKTNKKRVADFNDQFLDAVDIADGATLDDFNTLHPGSHCKFCPVEAVCPAKKGLAEVSKRFEVGSSTLEDLGTFLHMIPEMESWITAVQKMAHDQMDRGDKVPGFKLVHKRAYRKWADTDAVEETVKRSKKVKHEETHKSELLSPAQMEKLYKSKGLKFAPLEANIAAVSSGTTIAPDDDPRPQAPSIAALKALADRTSG